MGGMTWQPEVEPEVNRWVNYIIFKLLYSFESFLGEERERVIIMAHPGW